MKIIEPGIIPTKIEPNHIQVYCERCGCIFDAAEDEGILTTMLSNGIKEQPLYRSFYCPKCGKQIEVCSEMFDEKVMTDQEILSELERIKNLKD